MKKAAANIDEYIAGFPSDVQQLLQKVRKTIKKAAPGAEEAISYAIPTFRLNGNLVHFAAYQNHIGLYPAPRGIAEFEVEMARYGGGKGTARFPLDEPIPYELIARITTFRAGKNMESAASKSTKRRAAKKPTRSTKKQGAKKRSAPAKKKR